ncbi:hypothetical protein [Microbulbifer rhizosphaerae]|uniref:Uncharacterized protein n=1 Tax=Microbulbifer rhizosphaerae TaxID=1562603 RepID=A0A7W4ZA99_9GAMM|nr:hypothetical protein [Microbulbifer rhizosphaerae]MBB3062351.1 hypothetical protein [Microbulbifer rhizosphaerae]
MALWKQALAKLRGAADSVRPLEPGADSESDAVEDAVTELVTEDAENIDDVADATGSSSDQPAVADGEALARELRAGIQVSLGELESCAAGWRYRGHPVMVFGAEAPELTEPERRRDFFSQVHLFPCCGVLENEERSVWVATDLVSLNEAQLQGPFNFCRTCLDASAGRGSAPTEFDFPAHVRSHGDSYFAASPCHWKPGTNALPLQAPAAEAEGSCPNCGCASEEPGWQLSAGDVEQLALPEGICLLCAERQVDGCLHLGETVLLEAAWARYHYLVAQAAQAPAPSWKLTEAILPMAWQPLLRSLQQMLPPPELFYPIEEDVPPTVLAWPALSRGIVVDEALALEGVPGWSLWSRAQIESELGFKLR